MSEWPALDAAQAEFSGWLHETYEQLTWRDTNAIALRGFKFAWDALQPSDDSVSQSVGGEQ